VADEVGLVGRRIDSGGAIDFAISTNATLPDLTRFGGGFYGGHDGLWRAFVTPAGEAS
jgi:hypothetical protein